MRKAWSHIFHRGLGTLLGWMFFGGGCVVWGVSVVPVTLLLRPFWPGAQDSFRSLTHRWLGIYTRSLLFVRFELEGEWEDAPRPSLIVVNHQSWLDPIVLLGLERRLGGPARSYLFRVPFLRTILRMSGFFPSEETGALRRADQAAKRAKLEGSSLMFFPEGTRSRNGEIGDFKRGAFRLAFDHDLPIQPIVIEGLDRVLPRHSPIAQLPCRARVRVRYLPPLHPPYGEGTRRDLVRALSAQVRDSMLEELAKMRAGVPRS